MTEEKKEKEKGKEPADESELAPLRGYSGGLEGVIILMQDKRSG